MESSSGAIEMNIENMRAITSGKKGIYKWNLCQFIGKIVSPQEVDRYGINKCIEMALDHIDPANDRDYHISFDIDALDRNEAPSTGYARKYSFIFKLNFLFYFPFFYSD